MSDHVTAESLEGRLLVAAPGMGDARFEQSVIYMCAHSEEGAMGLIINKRARELSFADLLSQLEIEAAGPPEVAIHFGGPVEMGRGFVLHTDDYRLEDATQDVDQGVCLTATVDILRAMAGGLGPRRSLLALGYAGWAPGQLESEIRADGWLHCPSDQDLIFGGDNDGKWNAAMKKIGVDPGMLSGRGGRA